MAKFKIVWAVDPTQKMSDYENIITELKTWAMRLDAEVQPVSVFSESIFVFPADILPPWNDDFEDYTQRSLSTQFEKAPTDSFLTPQALFVTHLSRRGMARELGAYAEKKGADLIFTATRNANSWNPFRLGGFAETLLATSKVPVLLMSLKTLANANASIESVLFPTDFEAESLNALQLLEPVLKAFKSKLVLFNQIEAYDMTSPYIGWGLPMPAQASIEDGIEKTRTKESSIWIENLKAKGIEATAMVQRQRQSLSEEILKMARQKKVGLIAMASHSEPLTQVLLGSVARDVLAKAKCPVLIFHRPKQVLS